jgi:cell division GTPase FtsZ
MKSYTVLKTDEEKREIAADILRSFGQIISIDNADLDMVLSAETVYALSAAMSGADKYQKAAEKIVDAGAEILRDMKSVVIFVLANSDAELKDVQVIFSAVIDAVHPDANIIFGFGHEDKTDDLVSVIVLAALGGKHD